ncbi:hypothetical protein, partial [Luteimonas huabeiensis]|uniref:hypothetical protein n=1 Tax=Luteimonas huabeiensis TaxID=1244513 RepID=UPI0004B5D20E
MRQIFSSPRLENVEKVAELLEGEGIEVRITNGRSYHGKRRRHFSYRAGADSGPQAAVWVIRAEDQPRARELMREAGLAGPTTRPMAAPSAGAPSQAPAPAPPDAARTIARYRRALLIGIAIVVALVLYRV